MKRLPLFEDTEFLMPPSQGIWLWILAGIILAAAGIITWILLSKGKKEDKLLEEYLEKMNQLHFKLGKMDQYSFMTQASQILRYYIQDKFEIEATKQTTREFLGAIFKDERIVSVHRTLLGDFLNEADQVKFARKHHELDRLEKLHAAAVRFLMETRS